MSKPFNVPVGGESTKIDDVELIPEGFQLCVFYSLVDIGTHPTNFGEKRQLRLAFEFPKHYRKFYEDKDPQPASIFNTETFSLGEKANFRKLVHGMHKHMSDDEAANFDVSTLLGKYYVATVVHTYSPKHQKQFANMSSIQKIDDNMAAFFGINKNAPAQAFNTVDMFSIDNDGFDSDSFASLNNYMKDLIKKSKEGIAWSRQGGVFRENANGSTNHVPNQSAQQAFTDTTAAKYGIVMLNNEYTADQMIQGGWSVDLLISEGYAKRIQPTAPPVPSGGVPSHIQTPIAPKPPQPTSPAPAQTVAQPIATPSVPTPKPASNSLNNDLHIENDGVLQDWLAAGWTVESMLANGHAWYLNEDGTKSDVPF